MGGIPDFKIWGRGRKPGKINASLNKLLSEVEWGEYRLCDIFDHIEQGRRLKKEDQIPGKIPFVMAGETNTGVVGFISNPVSMFPANSITIDIFGNTFYRNYSFGAGDDTGVYWNKKDPYSENTMLFLTGAIQRALSGKFSYGNKLRSSRSYDLLIRLPQKNGNINFDFMKEFIKYLKAQKEIELEVKKNKEYNTYLSVAKLTDTKLSSNEEQVFRIFRQTQWKTFNLKDLFGKSTRGKRLKSEDRIPGNLPFVTAGEVEEGVSAFIGNDAQVFPANTITIDMFGSAKYRNYDYGGDDHIAVVHTEKLSKYAAVFVTAAIHKSAHTGQFNYGHNFYAKDADNLYISLPVTVNNDLDYEMIEKVISSVHKLVIQEIVALRNREIEAIKNIIDNN